MSGKVNPGRLAFDSFNKSSGPSRSDEPTFDFTDYINDPSAVGRAGIMYQNKQSRVINLRKNYYGFTVQDSRTMTDEEYKTNLNTLSSVAFFELQKKSQVVAVRIPFITFLPDPADIEDENIKKHVISCHTLVFPDPTILDVTTEIPKDITVKIRFLDENAEFGLIVSDPFVQLSGFQKFARGAFSFVRETFQEPEQETVPQTETSASVTGPTTAYLPLGTNRTV